MKNIFTTIEYVAEEIKEAITGHKNDEQAHQNLSEQINVLKGKVEWKARNWKSENALPSEFQAETQTMFYSNDSTWNGKRYVIIRVSKYTDTTVFQEVLDCNTGSVIMYRCSSTSEKWTTWETIATTTKTDILSSELLNGWVFDDASIEENIIKTGNIVSLHLVIKNPAVQGNNSHIYTIPSQYRPTKIVARDTKLRNSNTSIIIEVLPTGILRCNGYTEVNRTLSIDISWGVLT